MVRVSQANFDFVIQIGVLPGSKYLVLGRRTADKSIQQQLRTVLQRNLATESKQLPRKCYGASRFVLLFVNVSSFSVQRDGDCRLSGPFCINIS